MLDRHAAEVSEFCDQVIVSLDGPREIHDRTRRVHHAFMRLSHSLRVLGSRAPRLPVVGRCAVHRHNFRHLRATVGTARELGLWQISFSSTDLTNDAFGHTGGLPSGLLEELALDPRDIVLLEDELELLRVECKEEFASGFIAESPGALHRSLVEYYRAVAGIGAALRPTCNTPWTSVVIECDGTVRPCFYLAPYGNIHEAGGLDSVINSDRARQFRGSLQPSEHPVCRRCVCPVLCLWMWLRRVGGFPLLRQFLPCRHAPTVIVHGSGRSR